MKALGASIGLLSLFESFDWESFEHLAENCGLRRWFEEGMIAVYVGGNLHVGFVEFRCEFGPDIPHFADVGLRELKVAGVHKAGLNVGTGSASTLAVILRIDETAVFSQVWVEIAPCAREDLAEVGGGDLTYVGAYFATDLKDFAKDEDEPLASVEAKKDSDQAVVACFLVQNLERNRHGARVWGIEVRNLAGS